jgi:hypothetical protein
MVIEAPFLDATSLLEFCDERPIWQDPRLIARCHAFAAEVMIHAGVFPMAPS